MDTQCATQTLLAAGFLTKLDTCDKWGHGGLHGFFTHPGSKENGQQYYRCDVKECKAYTNVLAGCFWLENKVCFRCINPSRLYLTIQAYTHKQNPRRQDAIAFGVPPKAARCIFDHLRSMEFEAAERQLKDMKLSGQVGQFQKKKLFSNTCALRQNPVKCVIRIVFFEANVFTCVFFSFLTCQCCRSKWARPRFAHRFGASSQSFAPEIRKWQAKHKNVCKPKHFIGHLRVTGAIERGPAGRVLLDVLPLVALTPGARPPTESSYDVNQTRFFEKIQRGRGTRIHADGNRAWKAEAKKAGFQFSCVSHSRMPFLKKVPKKRFFTGTQLLDRSWKILKQFVVSNLRTCGKFDHRVDRRLLDQIKAFMYRHNAGHNLWKELGKLAQKNRR